MTYDPEPITDEQVDAYLDGLMKPEERAAFEARLRAHPEIAKEILLQKQMDASLERLFPVERISDAQLAELQEDDVTPAQPSAAGSLRTAQVERSIQSSKWIKVAVAGIAAMVAWIMVVWFWGNGTGKAPFFQPRPVALVYQEVLDNGFEPYYECHEEDRFAETFSHRQGQALRLTELPEGSRMLGLSYEGGISRDTTSMLCRVDGKPVMVFVDRLENDIPNASQNDQPDLHVYREARDGLVFYEVTPFGSARLIKHLVPLEAGKEDKLQSRSDTQ
jgi:hypothetical protein